MEIKHTNIEIRDIGVEVIPDWATGLPIAVPPSVPVTTQLGIPIVDLPGCVEAHETNNPKNDNLTIDDKRGSLTYCDAGLPSFNPIDYTPNQDLNETPSKVETRQPPAEPEPKPVDTNRPITITPPKTAKVECPNAKQKQEQPVGTVFDNGRKVVVRYELKGNVCTRVVEDVPIPAQIINAIPPAGTVTTTASIALVATTSALVAKPFADILLKVIKPTIKKVVKKIAAIRGKETKVQSKGERIAEQRERNEAIKSLRRVLKR